MREEWTCPFCGDLIEFGERFRYLVQLQVATDRPAPPPDFVCRECRVSIEENQRAMHDESQSTGSTSTALGRVCLSMLWGLLLLAILDAIAR
jgi:hypothetical protein